MKHSFPIELLTEERAALISAVAESMRAQQHVYEALEAIGTRVGAEWDPSLVTGSSADVVRDLSEMLERALPGTMESFIVSAFTKPEDWSFPDPNERQVGLFGGAQ